MSKAATTINAIPSSEGCMCSRCVSLCLHTPGAMTPDEAEAALKAGLAKKLMREFWVLDRGSEKNHRFVYMLTPGSEEFAGKHIPMNDELLTQRGYSLMEQVLMCFSPGPNKGTERGRCVFLHRSGCQLHDTGYKPAECRTAFGCTAGDDDPRRKIYFGRDEIALLWESDYAKSILAEWEILRVQP